MTIQQFIAQRGFTRKKCTRVAIERFRPENILRRKALIEWRKTVDPRQLFFVDETGIEDFSRRYGRSRSNCPLPSFAPKVKPDKTFIIGVFGFHELTQTILFDANYTAAISEQAMELSFFQSCPTTAIW